MKDKEYWINKFDLQPHPKETKGFFKETFRDEFTVIGSSGEQRSV
jgi:predicted cupin superfamily sugar epimerase